MAVMLDYLLPYPVLHLVHLMQTQKAALRNTPSSPRSFSQLALCRVICIPLVYR